MSRLLTDKEIKQARFQCVCSEGYNVDDRKATELAEYIAKAQAKKTLEYVIDKIEQARYEDYDGAGDETMVIEVKDWQSLKEELLNES